LEKYLAKYYEANGNPGKFEETIEIYLRHKKQDINDKRSYRHGLLEAAKLYLQYGNLVEAEAHLNATTEHFDNKSPEDLYQRTLFFEILTGINYQRANFDSFWESSNELLLLQERAIAPQMPYFSEIEKATVMREATPRALKRAQNAYIQTLVRQAEIATLQGEWEKAEGLLKQAENRTLENLGKQSQAYILWQFADAKLRYAKGENRAEIRNQLEAALYRAERILSRIHKDYIRIHQTLIEYYQDAEFVEKESVSLPLVGTFSDFYINTRYQRKNNLQRWELRQNTRRYFSKSKPPYAYALEADIKNDLRNDRAAQVVEELKTLLENTTLLPLKHPQRIALLRQAYFASLANFDTEKAELQLQELKNAIQNIIGENSLAYREALRLEADYLIRYTSNFAKAGEIH
jgi:hypothetical protein